MENTIEYNFCITGIFLKQLFGSDKICVKISTNYLCTSFICLAKTLDLMPCLLNILCICKCRINLSLSHLGLCLVSDTRIRCRETDIMI